MNLPLGQIALDVLSLPKDYVTELLKLGARLYDAFRELATNGKRTAEQYRAVRETILKILDAISDKPPFSYFDSAYSRAVVEDVYAEEKIARYAELLPASLPREVEAFAIVYIYLCNDLATFGTLMLNFVEYIVANDSRQPKALATTALFYFTHPEINRLLTESNPCPFIEGVSLRPRATIAPAIPYNPNDPDNIVIKKRVYYGRMMDFFIADLFDGLAHGHYVWKCGYCGRYFLMTTAHRQLYCQTAAEGQKYPCSLLAKHHKTATEQTKRNKQPAEANPLHLLWKKRDASIRKDKSRGKYPAELCESAKRYAKNCYERALGDAVYAETKYQADMTLENISEMLDRKGGAQWKMRYIFVLRPNRSVSRITRGCISSRLHRQGSVTSMIYFICAIREKDSAYFSHFLHHYESVLNAMAHRFLDFYYLPQNLLADLKQTFALTLWEQFLKYDSENAIPLLQIVHPIVKKQWHTMVARKAGALTMPEKVYAVWRKVAAISNKCRQEGLSQGEREARIYASFPERCHRAVKRALAMLATWREPMPLVTGAEPELDQGDEAVCAYEGSIADANAEPIDAGLWREEVFKAFKIAFRALSWKEKELFGKLSGIDPDTMEPIEPTDRETLAMTYNYSDESGVRKAELEITVKLTAELCKIGFADAVSVKKISPPEGYPKAKHLIYYNYFPLCGKAGGLMVVNTKVLSVTSGFRVLRVAEDDTMNSHRYAMLAAKGLEKEQKASADGKLPARLLVARHAHSRNEHGSPMQLAKRWATRTTNESKQEIGGK